MKERITYIIRDDAGGFDPSNIQVAENDVSIGNVKGAQETQLTLDWSELPSEIRAILTSLHELHIRWASSQPYDAIAPYVSRVSPGLHVLLSPSKSDVLPNICPSLKAAFGSGLKCDGVEPTFTRPKILSGRFSHSPSHQFYALVPDTGHLISYISAQICSTTDVACQIRTRGLMIADHMDIDYDAISQSLKLSVFWARAPTHGLHRLSQGGSLELGVLTNEKPDDIEELKYSGFLAQVGKVDKPSATLFSFPSRHHPLPSSSTFTTSFKRPTGLHPTLSVQLPYAASVPPRGDAECKLHTYLTLPSHLFIDRYPLSDSLFLQSHNLKALHTLSGATDLETPAYLVPAWGSASLFEVASPDSPKGGAAHEHEDFTFSIPLHARYLAPSNGTNGLEEISIPDPVLFWACPASTEEYAKFPTSPFDRVNLGYDGLFGPKTVFYHFSPRTSRAWEEAEVGMDLIQRLKVPVLDLEQAWYVEWGTVGVVVLGFLVVAVPLVSVLITEFAERWRLASGADGREKAESKKEK